MKKTVREISEFVSGEIRGDDSLIIESVASLKNAGESDLSYADEKFHAEVGTSRAGCILVNSGDFPGKTVITVRNPKLKFARTAAWLLSDDIEEGGIHATAVVAPDAILGNHVRIGPGAVVETGVRIGDASVIDAGAYVGKDCSIGTNCRLYPRVVLYAKTRIGNRVTVHAGAVIGADGFGFVKDGEEYVKFPQAGTVVIEDDVEIGANTCIDRGSLETTVIRHGTKLDNLIQIAHNVEIGANTVIASQTGISGSSTVGENSIIGGQVGIGEHAQLDPNTIIGGQSGVLNGKRVRGSGILWGTPVRPLKDFLEQQAHLAKLPRILREIKKKVRDSE